MRDKIKGRGGARKKNRKRSRRNAWGAETYRVEVCGFNQTKAINALIGAEIEVKNIQRDSAQKMLLNIRKKDSKKGFAILEEMCYTYRVADKFGINSTIRALGSRSAAVVSLAVFLFALIVSRAYIWKVDIDGNQKVADSVIETILREHDVAAGRSKNVDKAALKKAINALDDVLSCDVHFVGTTAKIDIIETTDFCSQPLAYTTDICAKMDAEITKIEARQGTAKARVGDRVFAGEKIIAASRLASDGETVISSLAEGRAYGKVALTFTAPIWATENKLVATGKTYKSTVLELFGLKIGKVKNPFEQFCSKRERVMAFDGNILPIIAWRETFTELELQTQAVNVQERAQELEREIITQNILKFGGEKISSTSAIRKLSETHYALDVFVKAEMVIT